MTNDRLHFETPELSYTFEEMQTIRKKLVKILHCDVLIMNNNGEEQ